MKNSPSDQHLFEQLRNAPAELSRDQVHTIIQHLPLIPVQAVWTNLLSFKMITMNTIILTFITASVIGLFPTKEISPASVPQQTEAPVPARAPLPPAAPIAPNPVPALPPPIAPQTAHPPAPISPPIPAKPHTHQQLRATPLSPPAPQTVLFPPPGLTAQKAAYHFHQPASTPLLSISTSDESSEDSEFEFKDILKLKRELRRKLSRDRVIASRKTRFILEFQGEKILVNKQPLSQELFLKYKKILLSYEIEPGPTKQIKISPESIMIGKNTDRGFVGMGRGKNMYFSFEGDRGLFDEN